MGDEAKEPCLKMLIQAKVSLIPGALAWLPPTVRDRFASDWAPVNALADRLRHFPTGLLHFLAGHDTGYVVLAPHDFHYVGGQQTIGRRSLLNVAYVCIGDLADDSRRPWHVVAHLLDHLMGCGGQPDGDWLSDGSGLTPRWQEVGQRVQKLFRLGYGLDEVARNNARDYFAQSVAWYCCDRQRLNVADPPMEKLLKTTIMDDAFWRP